MESIDGSGLTQADIVFMLQATSAPEFLLALPVLLPEPAQTKMGSTGLDESKLIQGYFSSIMNS
jgi:hypothetical protein